MFRPKLVAFSMSIALVVGFSAFAPSSASALVHTHHFVERGNGAPSISDIVGLGAGDAIEPHAVAKVACNDASMTFTVNVKGIIPIGSDHITPFNTDPYAPNPAPPGFPSYWVNVEIYNPVTTDTWDQIFPLSQDTKTGFFGTGTQQGTMTDLPSTLCATGMVVIVNTGPTLSDYLAYCAGGHLS